MIGLLGGFLAPVEVEYELVRSAEMYSSGRFDEGLKLILEKHAEIIAIIAPTLREENRAGWSPFMPICPQVRASRRARGDGLSPRARDDRVHMRKERGRHLGMRF